MADNFALPATGITGASDEIAGVHYQRIKIVHGPDGAATDTSAAAGLPVTEVGTDVAALTSVASSATSVVLLAANPDQVGALIHNDSAETLRIAYAATASDTLFTVPINPGYTWVMTGDAKWRGVISGIWEAADGAARITEIG